MLEIQASYIENEYLLCSAKLEEYTETNSAQYIVYNMKLPIPNLCCENSTKHDYVAMYVIQNTNTCGAILLMEKVWEVGLTDVSLSFIFLLFVDITLCLSGTFLLQILHEVENTAVKN